MNFLTTTLYLFLLLWVRAYGQSTTPATYTALQAQLKNQPDSVQMERLGDFVQARVEQGNFTETISANQDMLAIAKRTGNQRFLAQAYISAGYAAQNEGNPTQAVVQFQQAVSIYQKIGDWRRQANTLDRISWLYIDVRNLSLAEAYCTQALAIAQKHNLKGNIVNLYASLATVYDLRKQYKKALWFNAQSIKIAQSIGADYAGALLNRGIILKNAGQYTASVAVYQRALQWAQTHQYAYMEEMVYLNLPNTLLLLNRPDEAEHYVRLALKAVQQQPNQQLLLQEIYGTLTTIYEQKGQYRQALDYHKQWIVHRDSVFNAEKSRQLVEAETRFQAREKQQQIQRLDDDNLRQKQQLRWLIGGVSLLVLLLGVMVWQYRALRRANLRVNQALNDLKRTQNQLIQKEKMASLGELTAGIAHEIQNPLNFVNNFSEVSAELVEELKKGPLQSLPDHEKDYAEEIMGDLTQNLQKITYHGGRASSIVKSMLEHSRTASGERQPTDLNALADEYLRLAYQGVRVKSKDFTCEVVTDFDSAVGQVAVVPQEIGRVLLNLFNNAFYAVRQRAMSRSATDVYTPIVWVSTRQEPGQVVVRVRDNGTGIPNSVQEKIFQPFFTTKPTGEGTGLGLSLSYNIVTKGHSGALTVASTEGEGTELIITLPTKA